MLASLSYALKNITQFFVGDSVTNQQRRPLKRPRTPDSESDIEIVQEYFGGPRKKHRRNDGQTVILAPRDIMDNLKNENGSSKSDKKPDIRDSVHRRTAHALHRYGEKTKKFPEKRQEGLLEESQTTKEYEPSILSTSTTSKGSTYSSYPSLSRPHDTSVSSKLFPANILDTVGRKKPVLPIVKPKQSAITKPRIYGVQQSMRLDEKALYQNLLMRYTDAYRPMPKSTDVNRSINHELPNQSQFLDQTRIVTELGSFIEKQTYTSERKVPHRHKVEPHVLSTSERERRTSQTEDRTYLTPYTGSFRPSYRNLETPAQPDFEVASPPTQSPVEVSLSDSLSRSSVINKFSKYCSEDWIKQLKSKYEASEREKLRQIEESKVKVRIYRERRAEQEAKLEEQIRDRMYIAEKEPPVLDDTADTDEEDSLPQLTEEMENEIENALVQNPRDEKLSEGFGLSIRRGDIQTLNGLNWLNDEIVNFYMNLLMKRGQKEGNLKVHAFNTFFYPKLIKDGYSSLRRWTRKVSIFAMDLVFVPVHLGMHWCLAVIDFRTKSITYYDSMGGTNMQCLNKLRDYLRSEHLDKKKQEYDVSEWKLESIKDIPQQMNGSDCGMFACKFAEYISRDANISFSQEHMPYFRRRMIWEILHQQLL